MCLFLAQHINIITFGRRRTSCFCKAPIIKNTLNQQKNDRTWLDKARKKVSGDFFTPLFDLIFMKIQQSALKKRCVELLSSLDV